MGRINPNQNDLPINPAKIFAEWNGDKGEFYYYDKEEKKKVSLPGFTFIILAEMTTIKGFDEANECGIYSNEVKDQFKDKLKVKSFKGGLIAEGIYEDIKDSIKASGGKFTKSIYIAFKNGKDLDIGNIQLYGSGVDGWFEFAKANRKSIYTSAIVNSGNIPKKKGNINYFVPTFSLKEITQPYDDLAGELQKTVMAYLDEYCEKTFISLSEIEQVGQELKEKQRQENVERHARRPGDEKEVMDRHYDDSHIPDDGYVTPKEDLPTNNSLTGQVEDGFDDLPF